MASLGGGKWRDVMGASLIGSTRTDEEWQE
jgi:hypothetical protein